MLIKNIFRLSFNNHGSFSTALSHISCVLYRLKTYARVSFPVSSISMHMNLLQQFLHASLSSHAAKTIYLFQELFHTSVSSYADQEYLSMTMDLFQQLFHTSLGSYTNQGHIATTIVIFQQLFYTFLLPITDQEQMLITVDYF